MNFLAHTFLSGNNPHIKLGNFIGDAVKGSDLSNYHPSVQEGILLHRKIDLYTDSHPVFKRTCHLLKQSHGRYCSVVADMLYDHFLAVHWQTYSDQPLERFSKDTYKLLVENFIHLPAKTKRILPFMISSDWLSSYKSFEGLQQRFEGMNRRASFQSNMHLAVQSLQNNYITLEKDFFEFFDAVRNYCQIELK